MVEFYPKVFGDEIVRQLFKLLEAAERGQLEWVVVVAKRENETFN